MAQNGNSAETEKYRLEHCINVIIKSSNDIPLQNELLFQWPK